MSRCQHVFNGDWRQRCGAEATHYVCNSNGKRVPGVWCEKHATEIVEEYNTKLGWSWTIEEIEEEEE